MKQCTNGFLILSCLVVVLAVIIDFSGVLYRTPLQSISWAGEKVSETGKPWLGLYYGEEIPGFRILHSAAVHVSRYSSVDVVIESERTDPLTDYLAQKCKQHSNGGVGVVNIRKNIALGTVPGPRNSPNTMITNGMYIEYEGDCVTAVKATK